MAYAKQVWTDNVTPVDSSRMTHIEDGIFGIDPANYASATQVVWNGGDTKLYRASAGVLKTDSNLSVVGYVAANPAGAGTVAFATGVQPGDTVNRLTVDNQGKMLWGPGNAAGDANLYRAAAGILKSDGSLRSGGSFQANHGTGNDVLIGNGAGGAFRGISFINDASSAWDTSLYRSSPGELRTDGIFTLAGPLWNYDDSGAAAKGILFGSSKDAKLYRSGAAALSTDGRLSAGGSDAFSNTTISAKTATTGHNAVAVQVAGEAQYRAWIRGDGRHEWGSGAASLDTNLYRQAGGVLKTDGEFQAGGNIIVGIAVGTPTISFWPGDTILYRSAAGNLRTDGSFWVGQGAVIDASNAGNRLYFGSALDASIYRGAAGTLITAGSFVVNNNIGFTGNSTGPVAIPGGFSTDGVEVYIAGVQRKIPVF